MATGSLAYQVLERQLRPGEVSLDDLERAFRETAVEDIPVEIAPRHVVRAARKAAGLIGDGLYGVDIKQTNGKCFVIEINDNPNIDAGVEDKVLKDELYRRIMELVLRRIERRKAGIDSP